MAPVSKVQPQNVGHYRYYPSLILGKGNFATVYLARHKIVKCDVALKIIKTDDIKEDYVRRNLQREEKIMRTLHHPNIIQLYEVVQEKNLYCLSLELVRGINLYHYMTKQPNRSISEKLARYFFYQMLSAVEYMHNLNVIHRDLKLENILVECGHIIKIADFGLSNVYYPCVELRTHCGSIEYAAPELFISSAYGTAADVWSLGVVLYVMVVGKMPFMFCQKPCGDAFNAQMRHIFTQRISKGLMQDNWELMEKLSTDCWDLLHELLQPDQFMRIRIEDAITHPWIIRDRYLMRRLPQKRMDLQRKFHPEVIEYLAFKLNTSTTRIETHLHVYHNDKVAAMYLIVRSVLVKEVLYPPKIFENSFLYRFERWRENLNSQHTMQKYAYGDGYLGSEEKKEKFTEEKIVSFRDVSMDDNSSKISSQNSRGKFTNSFKLQTLSKISTPISSGVPVHSTKKIRQSISKDVNNETIKQEQEKNVPYYSYKKSRPEKVSLNQNSQLKVVKNDKCLNEIKKTSPDFTWVQGTPNKVGKLTGDTQNYHQNILNAVSVNEKKISTKCYQECSPSLLAAEGNKMKHKSFPETKSLVNETGKETKSLDAKKYQTRKNYSVNQIPGMKKIDSVTKRIEILKRTDNNMDVRDMISKKAVENNIGLKTPPRKSIHNFKKVDETLKSINLATPSKIPVKVLVHGTPTSFSQSPVPSIRKISRPSGIKLCRGDTREDVK